MFPSHIHIVRVLNGFESPYEDDDIICRATVRVALTSLRHARYSCVDGGTIYPRTVSERIMSSISMLVGGFTFGMIVGSLSDMVRRSNPGDSARGKKLGFVHAFRACLHHIYDTSCVAPLRVPIAWLN
jgi:hypothetical protein